MHHYAKQSAEKKGQDLGVKRASLAKVNCPISGPEFHTIKRNSKRFLTSLVRPHILYNDSSRYRKYVYPERLRCVKSNVQRNETTCEDFATLCERSLRKFLKLKG